MILWMLLLLYSTQRFYCSSVDEDKWVIQMLYSYVLLLPCTQKHTGDSKVVNQIALLQNTSCWGEKYLFSVGLRLLGHCSMKQQWSSSAPRWSSSAWSCYLSVKIPHCNHLAGSDISKCNRKCSPFFSYKSLSRRQWLQFYFHADSGKFTINTKSQSGRNY